MAITIARQLLTDSWTEDVDAVEAVVGRVGPSHADCISVSCYVLPRGVGTIGGDAE